MKVISGKRIGNGMAWVYMRLKGMPVGPGSALFNYNKGLARVRWGPACEYCIPRRLRWERVWGGLV